MSRLLTFVFGIVLGALGVYALFLTGALHVPGPLPVEGIPAASVPPASAPLPPANGVELPAAPSLPAPVASTSAPLPMPPLADSDSTEASVATTSSTGANASEAVLPSTTEAAAAVTAAHATAQEGQALLLPVQGVQASKLVDTFTQSRGAGRLHDAIDIMAARGTPVLAVADGRIAKLFTSKPGGLTVYQFDREEKLAYYYAHLDHYAPGLAEGQVLKRGDLVGFVGSTGNASPEAPHLHFAVFVLGPEKRWWKGTAVNPYPLLGGR